MRNSISGFWFPHFVFIHHAWKCEYMHTHTMCKETLLYFDSFFKERTSKKKKKFYDY